MLSLGIYPFNYQEKERFDYMSAEERLLPTLALSTHPKFLFSHANKTQTSKKNYHAVDHWTLNENEDIVMLINIPHNAQFGYLPLDYQEKERFYHMSAE